MPKFAGYSGFVAKARKVHGYKYDYSKVEYRTCKDKVTIICPIHGEFQQTPDHHVQGCGCPECKYSRIQETVRKRYGVDYISQSAGFQERVEATNLKKYGVRRPMQGDAAKRKSVETCQDHWGVDHPMKNKELADKCRQSLFEHYGVRFPFLDAGILEKYRQIMLERYGVENPMMVKSISEKSFATKRERGTSNSSSEEVVVYALLCERFGDDDIEAEYVSEQYPFHCDFYVKSLDLYIELNISWVHGGHWFDQNNEDDVLDLTVRQEKAKAGSKYYARAVKTWSVSDLEKRDTAIKNNLNYVVFWNSDLSDFMKWFESETLELKKY